jgi:hypothetical protein
VCAESREAEGWHNAHDNERADRASREARPRRYDSSARLYRVLTTTCEQAWLRPHSVSDAEASEAPWRAMRAHVRNDAVEAGDCG